MKLLLFVFVLLCWFKTLNAQQTASAAGGNVTGSSGSVSYTLGQISYANLENNTCKITQGVQQPYEILILSGSKEDGNQSIHYKVYPNPTTENLMLNIENQFLKNLSISIFKADGMLLQKIKIEGHKTIIPMEDFPAGTYLLEIFDSHKVIRTFKIIKTLR